MSQASRLREAIASAAFHYPGYSRFQVYLVPNGNINGLYSQLGAQGGTNDLAIISYFRKAARCCP